VGRVPLPCRQCPEWKISRSGHRPDSANRAVNPNPKRQRGAVVQSEPQAPARGQSVPRQPWSGPALKSQISNPFTPFSLFNPSDPSTFQLERVGVRGDLSLNPNRACKQAVNPNPKRQRGAVVQSEPQAPARGGSTIRTPSASAGSIRAWSGSTAPISTTTDMERAALKSQIFNPFTPFLRGGTMGACLRCNSRVSGDFDGSTPWLMGKNKHLACSSTASSSWNSGRQGRKAFLIRRRSE